jgi:hypothetical protein
VTARAVKSRVFMVGFSFSFVELISSLPSVGVNENSSKLSAKRRKRIGFRGAGDEPHDDLSQADTTQP